LKDIDCKGKTEGKGPLGRPRRRWMDNINVDLKKRMGDRGLYSSGLRLGQVDCSERGNKGIP
jgi:hypothetical protein